MFSPASAIAALDNAIAKTGQSVSLRRLTGDINIERRASVRDYTPDEIGSGIIQGDTEVVLSPTALAGTPFEGKPPKRLDRVLVADRLRNIESAEPVYMMDVLVRLNLQVRG